MLDQKDKDRRKFGIIITTVIIGIGTELVFGQITSQKRLSKKD